MSPERSVTYVSERTHRRSLNLADTQCLSSQDDVESELGCFVIEAHEGADKKP